MTDSPFQLAAPALRANGYSVLPIIARSKRIVLQEWSRYCEEGADQATFDQWMTLPGCNIGVCLGSASGITALDYDDDINGLHAKILRIVGDSPVKKFGAKGYTAFYRHSNERSAQYRVGGVNVLDVLSTGRQTVIPPSIHPEGAVYRWLTEKTLENTPASDLPPISSEAMVEVMRLFRLEQPVIKPTYRDGFDFDHADDAAQALGYLNSDEYNLWIQVGMALKQGKGEAGFPLWDAWSATSTKYGGSAVTRKKWDSFKGSGVNIETLFWNAIERGYRPPVQRIETVSVIQPGGNLTDPQAPEKKTAEIAPPAVASEDTLAILNNPPGLVGLIAEHINSSARYPLPLLSLAAGIALAGVIMANKVESPTGLRTNFYTLGVAVSCSGKDHPRMVSKEILQSCGLGELEIGIPKSGAGLLSGIRKANNTGIVFFDEFGKYMATITNNRAASHEAEISRLMMELFTSAGSTFSGMEYADHDGKMPRHVIVNPCLCMYPVTTPERFYESMTKRDAVDGFMARFLVFEVDDYPVMPVKPKRKIKDIPDGLRTALDYWRNRSVNSDPHSNMGALYTSPAEIPWSPGADEKLTRYMCDMRLRWNEHRIQKTGLHAVYGRMAEQAIKLALVAHEGGEVSESVADWAIKVSDYCGERMIRIIQQNVSDNEQERNAKDILRIIGDLCGLSENGLASHSDVVLKTTRLKRQERRDLIDDAIMSRKIIPYEGGEPGKPGPKPMFYKLAVPSKITA